MNKKHVKHPLFAEIEKAWKALPAGTVPGDTNPAQYLEKLQTRYPALYPKK